MLKFKLPRARCQKDGGAARTIGGEYKYASVYREMATTCLVRLSECWRCEQRRAALVSHSCVQIRLTAAYGIDSCEIGGTGPRARRVTNLVTRRGHGRACEQLATEEDKSLRGMVGRPPGLYREDASSRPD